MKEVIVSSVSMGGSAQDPNKPTENQSLNFAAFSISINGGEPFEFNIAENAAQ
jgi:type VI protein secretion system component Hcp